MSGSYNNVDEVVVFKCRRYGRKEFYFGYTEFEMPMELSQRCLVDIWVSGTLEKSGSLLGH